MDHETILRLLGYTVEFFWLMAPVAILGGLTWRLTR